MHLHEQSQRITHFGINVLCLDLISSLLNHCLFHKSLAKIVHILEISSEETMYIGYQPWEEGAGIKVNFIK